MIWFRLRIPRAACRMLDSRYQHGAGMDQLYDHMYDLIGGIDYPFSY
jgi:hypothetical protein